MSKDLPETQPSEEIDLGQLFRLIGNAFDRFFRFIGSILNNIFLAFVWFVFFTKKHLLKLVFVAALGVGFGFLKQNYTKPVYKSTIVIKQNYDTGEHLYNTVEYYNSLLNQKDSIQAGKILKISPEQAGKILGLEIESNLTENQKIKLFDEYTQSLDSVLASQIEYKDFLDNSKDYNYNIQRLILKSSTKSNFSDVLLNIVDNVEDSDFFKELRKKQIDDLTRRDSIIIESLKESKALQEVYKEVLQKPLEELPSGATTNIAIGDTKDQNTTKEFELFGKDLELRRELVENKLKRNELQNIIEVISSQNGDGTLVNEARLFGIETSWTIALVIKLTMVFYIILLLIEFVRYLERFKDKVQ